MALLRRRNRVQEPRVEYGNDEALNIVSPNQDILIILRLFADTDYVIPEAPHSIEAE